MCPEPEAPLNGYINGSDFSYGKEIMFGCDEGYELGDSDRAKCGITGWDSEPPTCAESEYCSYIMSVKLISCTVNTIVYIKM